ncbi:AAA family ATPase [bacterium]|nr:AAA family ATPase [bacterium]
MHITKLTIKNFRRIGQVPLEVHLKQGLNILIGENNIGKTAVVEAIALVLGYGSADRSPVQLQPSDFQDRDKPIEISLELGGLSDEQESAFIEALDISEMTPVLRFQFRFHLRENKIAPEITCGQHANTRNPYDLLPHLNCHYLKALRDVSQEFKPGSRNRIGRILNKLFSKVKPEDQKNFLEIFRTAEKSAVDFFPQGETEAIPSQSADPEANEQSDQEDRVGPIKKLQTDSNALIGKLQFAGDDNTIVLGLHERQLADVLYTVFPRSGTNNLDLALNGLGYNNLIYVAVLLTEIEQLARKQDFMCLLIEEPEAHLHPQLQRLLLEFLRSEYKHVQVLITSHSPNFVADSELDDLILLTRGDANEPAGIAFSSLGLKNDTKRFLRKFLDVTKSQLFFARSIVFVEGYTEAILFRAFWDSYHSDEEMKFHKASIEVVNIGGVGFKHYADLVQNVFPRTGTRCVLLIDDDRGTGKAIPENEKIVPSRDIAELVTAWPHAKPSGLFENTRRIVEELKDKGCRVEICAAQRTFEVEFAFRNVDKEIVKRIVRPGVTPSAEQEPGDAVNVKLSTALALWKAVEGEKVDYALEIIKTLETAGEADRPVPPAHFIKAFEYLNGSGTSETSES